MTDRVNVDTNRYHAEQERTTPTEAEIADARREIIEEVLAGERVGKLDLETIIEAEIQRNYAATLRSLYEHFAGIGNDGRTDEYDRCMKAGEWMTRLVEAAVTEDCDEVAERAIANREDSE